MPGRHSCDMVGFWFHLVYYLGKHAVACRALLFYRSPLLVSRYSLGTFGDSLFPLCENGIRIRLVSQLTYINLTILYNKRGRAPVTELIYLKPYDTSKGTLLLGQFSELDTSGYNSTSLFFSEGQTKRRQSALPTRVQELYLAPISFYISHWTQCSEFGALGFLCAKAQRR